MDKLLNFLWWLSVIFTIWLSIGYCVAVSNKVPMKGWAMILLITSVVYAITMY